jgi:hypothetical protein
MFIMKFVLLFTFLVTSVHAQTSVVLDSIFENNHREIFDGIIKNNFSSEHMDLLGKTIELQNTTDDAIVDREQECDDINGGEQTGENLKDTSKKRKVTKSKSVESLGFELVFLAEASSYRTPHTSDLMVSSDTNSAQVDQLYGLMSDANSEEEMYQILDQYLEDNDIKNMSLQDQALFAAGISNNLPYSSLRSQYKQEFNQGAVSLFTMITTDNDDLSGICGDIHAAHNELMKKINPELEAYTMSYAVDNSQHVISYIVDPEDPNKVIMTNYSRVEVKQADGVSNLAPTNTSMDDVGERVRFFQYKNGRQDHVGTFRNDIGSLLYEMSTADFERDATPNDQRYSTQQVQNSWSKVVNKYKTIEKANGDVKVKNQSYVVNNDLIFFRGTTTTGNELVGILHKRQKLQNVDANGNLLPGERFGSHSFMSTSVGHVDYDRETSGYGGENWYDNTKYFKVYFVTGKRWIKRIVEKKGFIFDGFIGHQLEAGVTMDVRPSNINDSSSQKALSFNTGDGDYSVSAGFRMKADLGDKNTLRFNTMLTNSIGVDDERAIYSFKTNYPQNLQLTPNALQANVSLDTFTKKGTIRNTADYTGTQMGGKAGYRFEFLPSGGGKVFVGFTAPIQGISANKINVLPENYVVFKAGISSPDLLPKKKANLQFNARLDYAPGQLNPVNAQGGIRLGF